MKPHKLTIPIKLDVKLSLWSAIKLRIAGIDRTVTFNDGVMVLTRKGKPEGVVTIQPKEDD